MQILSDIVIIPKINNPSSEYIESKIKDIYPNILRWAIVDILADYFKVSVTYEK